MDDTTRTPDATVERFVEMITPRRRNPDRPPVEDADFVAMLWRMVRALEARAINDPALLPQVVALQARMAEVANVTIATSAARYAVNPHSAPSMAECARTLDISVPAASQRRKVGDRIIGERVTAAGAAKFSEAARERAEIERAEAHAVVSLEAYKARHRAA